MDLDDFDVMYVFAVPGEHSIIDCVHPATGKSAIAGETLEQIRARRPEYAAAEMILWKDWQARRAAEQDTPVMWSEVTEERYFEMLEVLPPVNLSSGGFQVGEPSDHHAQSGQPRFAAFVTKGGKHYESSRPMTSAEFRAFMRSA